MTITMYATAIKNASATNNLRKMKAAAKQARQLIKEQGDLYLALIELEEAIAKLEKKA